MRRLIAVWPYAAVFWLTFACCYAPEVRLNWQARSLARLQRGANAEAGINQDSGSYWTIWAIQIPTFSAAFVIAFLGRFGVLSQRQLWFWTGLAIMIMGNLLRRHCVRMLGSSFTAVVVVNRIRR